MPARKAVEDLSLSGIDVSNEGSMSFRYITHEHYDEHYANCHIEFVPKSQRATGLSTFLQR